MSSGETSRHLRLHVELVLEITHPDELTGAALEHIAADEFMPEEERGHAQAAVREEAAEALAYLVDPFDMVSGVPGVELAHASWTSEHIRYDPDAVVWDLDEEDIGYGDEEDEDEDEDEDDE